MKYLVIPLLIFNFLFLAIFDDHKEDILNRATTKEIVKTDTFDSSLLNHDKKDSIQTIAISLKE